MFGKRETLFADASDALAFKRRLQLFAALADKHDGGVSAVGYTLNGVIEAHGPGDSNGEEVDCALCGGPFPCATVLLVVAGVGFPIDWSMTQTAEAIRVSEILDQSVAVEVSSKLISFRSDPDMHWRRERDGWNFTVVERGETTRQERLADHEAPLHLLSQAPRSLPFPYGWHAAAEGVGDLTAAVAAAGERWQITKAAPLFEEWR